MLKYIQYILATKLGRQAEIKRHIFACVLSGVMAMLGALRSSITTKENILNIRIEYLASTDFSEVVNVSEARQPPIHPGVILMEDWLKPMGLRQYALAKAIAVPPRRIHEIVHGLRAITADTALRFAEFFGTDAESWINLQTHYDIELSRVEMRAALLRIRRYHPPTVAIN